MKKKEDYKMSYSQIKSGVKKALSNSLTLAGYSKDIIERGGNSYLALGLFSFAIEEFGKVTMLSEIIESKQKEYSVPTVIFLGKNSHDLNFDKAMSILPKEYVNFEMGGTKGASAIRDILIDFQTRMNCFYLDWDKEKNNWKSPPKVLPVLLEKSISEFESFVNKKLDIEYNSKEPT